MAHIPLFFLCAAVLYLTIKLHREPRMIYFIVIGFAIGLIGLIRVTDLWIICIPILYKVYNSETLVSKIKFVKTHYIKIIIGGLVSIVPIIPQLIYWEIMSGDFFYYSYGNQKLDLSNPHIINGWISSDNGWLHYSPFMILSLLGMLFYNKNKSFFYSSIIVFLGYSYFIYSWFCYQYVNGFGSRPMIDIYPLLAFPIAAFMIKSLEWKKYIQLLLGGFIIFTLLVNIVFTHKQLNGKLWSEYSSFTFNASTLFKDKLDKKDLITMDVPYLQPRSLNNFKEVVIAFQNFESDLGIEAKTVDSSKVYWLRDLEYSPVLLSAIYNPIEASDAKYIKVSGKFKLMTSPYYYYHFSELAFNVKRGGESIFNKAVKIDNKLGLNNSKEINLFTVNTNVWDTIEYYIPLPTHIDFVEEDMFEVYINSQKMSSLYIDELTLSYLYSK